MVEEIVTIAAPKKTKKTIDAEVQTEALNKDWQVYVADETTRQKLLDLVTAKITATGNKYEALKPKTISPIWIIAILGIATVIGWFIVSETNLMKNE